MDLDQLKESFQKRNIEAISFKTLDAARSHILNTVSAECAVGIGHSGTLQKINLTNTLLERGNTVYDKELARTATSAKR